jgi:hypothetical protein
MGIPGTTAVRPFGCMRRTRRNFGDMPGCGRIALAHPSDLGGVLESLAR